MEEKVVNFHFLLVYHSYLSDPVFGDPCAYGGGDEDLCFGGEQGEQGAATGGIEFAEDIVDEKNRGLAGFFLQEGALGHLQGDVP